VPANDMAIALKGISIHGFNIHRFCSGGEEQTKSLEEALSKVTVMPVRTV